MTQQSSNITKLEWVSCPDCSQTFQVAVPAKATDMRVIRNAADVNLRQYYLRVRCINPTCKRFFFVETDLSAEF